MATKKKHTPGPWKLMPGRNHHYKDAQPGIDYEATMQRCYYIGTNKPADFVADLIVDPFDHTSGEANARLIVAAPDLLAACKAAMDHFKRGAGMPELAAAAIRRCKAAIAKAEARKVTNGS